MPKRLYSCTPSRLNTWLDCPRRYRFTYLDRPAPKRGHSWAHNSLGASVHNALAAWWREPYDRRTPVMAALLVTKGWITEGYRDPEQSALWLGRARAMVTDYTGTLDPSDEPVGVERTVATRTPVIAVSGRVDRIDRRGDELVIVDYKTGRRPLTEDDARSSLALAIYAVASSRVLHRPCHRVELHHLPTASVAVWEHTDASLRRHIGRAEDMAVEASEADERYRAWRADAVKHRPRPKTAPAAPAEPEARQAASPTESAIRTAFAPSPPGTGQVSVPPEIDKTFPPRPGPICPWCDYRDHCPEGQAAGPAARPWDGVVDSPGPAEADTGA
ncbi:PD-(D/E)XK nuclease family protein [Sphaerisporangium sp. TRM90804]|uniref:RecB family exonuclease n=1 Tax=Sphaerisporangium sp. TRM90804 TaxID=3031113 RepID=UPI00244704C3|nr:PD-(D/E)XK nuclease family protein [Sphaerisporangium sp. TRM90804]MDH2429844.1 PD-(D/E)XK nuclease family protein [Sphaerisporangium sp. TRM90804]